MKLHWDNNGPRFGKLEYAYRRSFGWRIRLACRPRPIRRPRAEIDAEVKKEAEQRERDDIAAAIQIRRHKVDEIRRLFKNKDISKAEAKHRLRARSDNKF